MIGGFQDKGVTEEARAAWASVLPSLETNGNWVAGKTWEINSVQTQVVAGTNYLFAVTSNDGDKKTVKVFVPLPYTNAPAEVSEIHDGHQGA